MLAARPQAAAWPLQHTSVAHHIGAWSVWGASQACAGTPRTGSSLSPGRRAARIRLPKAQSQIRGSAPARVLQSQRHVPFQGQREVAEPWPNGGRVAAGRFVEPVSVVLSSAKTLAGGGPFR